MEHPPSSDQDLPEIETIEVDEDGDFLLPVDCSFLPGSQASIIAKFLRPIQESSLREAQACRKRIARGLFQGEYADAQMRAIYEPLEESYRKLRNLQRDGFFLVGRCSEVWMVKTDEGRSLIPGGQADFPDIPDYLDGGFEFVFLRGEGEILVFAKGPPEERAEEAEDSEVRGES